MPQRILVTGGATGGHVLPALSVALELQRAGHAVVFAGARDGLEERMCEAYGVPFRGLRRARPRRAGRSPALGVTLVDALRLLERLRPHAVFSKASPICVPVVAVARLCGVPVVLHESDAVPGSESRLVAPFCDTVCVGHPAAVAGLRCAAVFTGNVVRPAFAGGERDRCLVRFGLPADRPLIFVTGGSQGAVSLNELLRPILPSLLERWSVLHQVGPGRLQAGPAHEAYVAVEFLDRDLRDVYATADLLVGRAGATTIAEAAAYRVPAVLVPYPWADDDHQLANARHAMSLGVATVSEQPGLTPPGLLRAIQEGMAMRHRRRGRYGAPFHQVALANVTSLVTAAARSSTRAEVL
jgi:UDP-N-acetylglucosamine--N-acetylmuramyl-(pentapeptide) pyrophosphoryl-undecaprenol N-acetylglucosamine transferase